MGRRGAGDVTRRAGSRPASLPAPFRRIRSAGLVAAWLGAVLCGWQASGSFGASQSPGERPDLLAAVLRGAAAWLGLTVIWLAGMALCQRIIQSPAMSGQPSALSSERSELKADP